MQAEFGCSYLSPLATCAVGVFLSPTATCITGVFHVASSACTDEHTLQLALCGGGVCMCTKWCVCVCVWHSEG